MRFDVKIRTRSTTRATCNALHQKTAKNAGGRGPTRVAKQRHHAVARTIIPPMSLCDWNEWRRHPTTELLGSEVNNLVGGPKPTEQSRHMSVVSNTGPTSWNYREKIV